MDDKIVRHAVIVVKNGRLADFWIPTPTSDFSHFYVRHADLQVLPTFWRFFVFWQCIIN